jgi:pyruvate/2-oxoglutarate dehydrogenase complex dihydrolipoamide dehydrogenase (E3) component
MERYEVLAIGGGAAGLVVAAGAAGMGARAALVEVDRLGGERLWSGCVPSKALLAAARAVRDARRAERLGVDVGPLTVDYPRVMARVRDAQTRIQPNSSPDHLRALGVEVVEGTARFVGEDRVSVDGRLLTARHVVIATGSRPAVPPIPGLQDVPFLTNETVFDLERVPNSLLVLGGGAIGLELGQALALLGCQVTVVEVAPQILPEEDPELTALLRSSLEADGLRIVTRAALSRVTATAGGVSLEAGAGPLRAERLLVATGRRPAVEGLELSAAGVELARDGIRVDRSLRTTAPGIWAAGDAVGPLRYTHVASYQARLALRNALLPFRRHADYSAVPRVVYTEPGLARVGLTEPEARERYGDGIRVWCRAFADGDRAIVDERTEGLVKLIASRRGRLLGAHVLAHEAATMIQELVLAMHHGIGLAGLAGAIHPYPTYPETILQAAELGARSGFAGSLGRAVRRAVSR